MNAAHRPLALVTGASSGIGRELAIQCARHGYDLMIVADTPLTNVVPELRRFGGRVEWRETDLSTKAGVDQ
ncbi:MAG: SDR family NAD(P)-dependent oxidoreductase, partial [Steroidobacteraceae bacterium]